MQKIHPERYAWRDILALALTHRRELVVAHVAAILAALMSVPVPLLMPLLVDEVLLQKPGRLTAAMQALLPDDWQHALVHIAVILLVTILLRLLSLVLQVWQTRQFSLLSKDLKDFIAGMAQGLETVIGRDGIRLSGGQRQRLAIARMLLTDPNVVILDEATSALDVETEARFYAALPESLRGRTMLIIAHRLSAVKTADRVYVFDGGRIVEQGAHQELIAQPGLYRRLYSTTGESSRERLARSLRSEVLCGRGVLEHREQIPGMGQVTAIQPL